MDEHFPQRRHTDKNPRGKRQRKGMYLLPSLFTSINIAAGYYAILHAVQGSLSDPWRFDVAAKAIGFAILADGLDGRIARLTNTTSDFGRELDSLADVLTFGLAPAILAWFWGFRFLPETGGDLRARLIQLGAIATFLFLIAGAARLARFNIQVNPQPSNPGRPGKKYFVGMPIPAAAGVIAAVVHFTHGAPITSWWPAVVWLLLVLAAAFLMVSTWRFYSFKDLDLRTQRPFPIVILTGLLIAACWYFSNYVLFFLALAYMLSGVIVRLLYVIRRHSSPPPSYSEVSEVR
jgi:CDP-diacylglycerol--serine O-phosphatidyltransferase